MIELEYEKVIASYLSKPIQTKEKTVFTQKEIKKLWKIINEPFVDSVLFLLYTGYRTDQMLSIKKENVDLENGLLIRKNSVIPIHTKIFNLVQNRYYVNSVYLFSNSISNKLSPVNYLNFYWQNIMSNIKANHIPNECRHTFRTELSKFTNDIKAINHLMGRVSRNDYADNHIQKSIDELKSIIELITY